MNEIEQQLKFNNLVYAFNTFDLTPEQFNETTLQLINLICYKTKPSEEKQ